METLYRLLLYFNWAVVSLLGVLVLLATLEPKRGGGDAAGRGMGEAIYYLAVIAFVVLLVLNLLPWQWPKVLAFALLVVPFIFFKGIQPIWKRAKKQIEAVRHHAQPIFEDAERDAVARAIRDGDVDKVKALLKTPPARLNEEGDLLAFAIQQANGSYRPEEKLACVRLLFEAGATLGSLRGWNVPVHMAVADTGNATLLRLLLEHGANANAYQPHFKTAIIFQAIGGYQQPLEAVRALLDHGADTEAVAIFDDKDGRVTPLFRAAKMGRWDICSLLLERGANREFRAPRSGVSFRDVVREAESDLSDDGYSRKADYERLKAAL
ncbi:MAG TPA: ankyrin repeat domain-containing protein [Saprospiraceae bacterium]|nr:ankyrin repeat domain-containing protein [Saprospiraceae bacterium]HND87434.1 ankyrin repeat domain-containing protein [Saprospiraceae bacterium]HNG90141.1 ankyrin repeat domain-containing protein [Saprospiraceae bacterium]